MKKKAKKDSAYQLRVMQVKVMFILLVKVKVKVEARSARTLTRL